MGWGEAKALLARKAALTPQMCIAVPGAPFPWFAVPYLHGTMHPNASYANGAFTTDALGLRHVVAGGERIGFRDFQQRPGKRNLLMGASTAYSMGSSSDETAMASQLWRATGEPWFHLAMGSYVSTQEVLLYWLVNPQGIDQIVLLSGLNTLSTCVLNRNAMLAEVFSPNFFVTVRRPSTWWTKARRYALRTLRNPLGARALRPHGISADAHSVELALGLMKRDLGVLQAVCRARGVRLTFVSQPLLPLLGKPLSSEESEISEIQRTLGAYPDFALWWLHLTVLPQLYPAYGQGLRAICEGLGIGYHDLNGDRSLFATTDWLFSDQAHLTDAGYRVCAARIAELVACEAVHAGA